MYRKLLKRGLFRHPNNPALKTPIVKAIASAIILCLPAASIFASPHADPADTTRKPLQVSTDKKPETILVLKESNVEFPAILTGNEEQSIDYIEKFSTTRKGYLVRTYNRSKKLFPKAAAILEKYNVPQEFKVLLALESGFNPNAISSAGAVGYWQIMDEVAREYGLKTCNGLPMLVGQAVFAQEHWQEQKIDLAIMEPLEQMVRGHFA